MGNEKNNILGLQAQLREQLLSLISYNYIPRSDNYSQTFDVIITCNEVNERHGTGVLLRRIFKDSPNIFSIRSCNHYGGEHDFGEESACLPQVMLSRADIFAHVLQTFQHQNVRRILCIPYYPSDVLVAIAIKEVFNIPLCTYIMDDQNICSNGIPDSLMRELLDKSSLRLAISPEMRQAYEGKYRLKFWVLPPVVSNQLLQLQVSESALTSEHPKAGILVGNIWDQSWLDLLRESVRDSGVKLDWYCNNASNCQWLSFDINELERDGIFLHHPLPEVELVPLLRKYSFAIIPSGTLDANDDRRFIAELSLPSRIPFIFATSNTPIIVLGNKKTAVARFVERFQIGITAEYSSSSFSEAVSYVTKSENQLLMRQNATTLAENFGSQGMAEWIWQSLERGEAADIKFEKLMPPLPSDLAYYIEPPVPKDIVEDFVPVYQAVRRLKKKGFNPDFVVDVGASTGIWSHYINKLFPNARFILIDPLASKYDDTIDGHANFEFVEAAISNQLGTISLQVSSDLYRSSLLPIDNCQLSGVVNVEVKTLDSLAREKQIFGRGLLKVDVQLVEHLVIEGGRNFIEHVDAVILELTLIRMQAEAKTFLEMLDMMDKLGFRYYDDVGEWRSPVDGFLEQKDGLFVRKEMFN
ncbi:MAG: FkbM family methyltransferase [Calothrix sp. FI2-JRJ7]|jgi:FkbM family methyltransferase|nr:FkbM family methyltransferase [Calothrix sp. FI2-JRJ7]